LGLNGQCLLPIGFFSLALLCRDDMLLGWGCFILGLNGQRLLPIGFYSLALRCRYD